MNIKYKIPLSVILIMIAGLILRLSFAFLVRPVNGDSAVFAIMAKNIYQLKDFPIYMPLAHYAGSLSSYIGAFLFMIFGSSYNVYMFVGIILSSAYLIFGYLICRELFDPFESIMAFLMIAVPSFWVLYYSSFTGVHGENFLFIPLLLFLVIKFKDIKYSVIAQFSEKASGHNGIFPRAFHRQRRMSFGNTIFSLKNIVFRRRFKIPLCPDSFNSIYSETELLQFPSMLKYIFMTGFISGLALWTTPAAMPAILVVISVFLADYPLLFRATSDGKYRKIFFGAYLSLLFIFSIGFLLGYAPAIIYNFKHPGANLFRFAGRILDLDRSVLACPDMMNIIFSKVLWRLSTIPGSFIRLPYLCAELVSPFMVVLFLCSFVISFIHLFIKLVSVRFHNITPGHNGIFQRAFHRQRRVSFGNTIFLLKNIVFRRRFKIPLCPGTGSRTELLFKLSSRRSRPEGIMVILMYAIFFWIFYAFFVGEPDARYAAPLCLVMPFIIVGALSRLNRHRKVATVFATGFVLLCNLDGIARGIKEPMKDRYETLIKYMNNSAITKAYSDYDTAYITQFLSDGRMVVSPTLVDGAFSDRWPEYTEFVFSDNSSSFVLDLRRYGNLEGIIEDIFRAFHEPYERHRADDFLIYRPLSSDFDPKILLEEIWHRRPG